MAIQLCVSCRPALTVKRQLSKRLLVLNNLTLLFITKLHYALHSVHPSVRPSVCQSVCRSIYVCSVCACIRQEKVVSSYININISNQTKSIERMHEYMNQSINLYERAPKTAG